MNKNFQLIVLVVFVIAAVFAVFVFSGAIPLGKDSDTGTASGTVVLWGTVKASIINTLLEDFNLANDTFAVRYVEKSEETFDKDLLEALASGIGPDMFFINEDLVVKYSNKIFAIPYSSFPVNTFKDNFIGAGEVFLTSKGVLAFPLAVDPLMMYYNRSILNDNGIAYPPSYWDELKNLAPILNEKDEEGRLTRSTVAMGQFSNVMHAKDLMAALFMQIGNPIITEIDGSFASVLDEGTGNRSPEPVLKFYTDFANPLNDVYSWNKGFANSGDAFSKEQLVFYFGFASELQSLINKNPNQNFDVVSIPQIRGSNFKLTSSRVTGVAISAFSKNFNTAFTASGLMAQSGFASRFADALLIAPARRDLLANTPTDAYLPKFYASAFFAKGWLDPSREDTDDIFRGMVGKVLSNSLSVTDALEDASEKLRLLLIPNI